MERREATEQQLRKDHELLKKRLPDLLFKVLKNPELEDELDHELVFRPDMKTARCRRKEDEIHFGTDNSKMENLRVARKTLVHEAIHAVGVNHNARMRSLNFYSQLSRDLFTDKIMEKLGWEPPSEKETRRRSRRKGKQDYKYVAYCPECGNEWYRKRRSKLIKHPGRYQCGECGSRLESRELEEKE